MDLFKLVLLPPRFLKALFLLSCTYIAALKWIGFKAQWFEWLGRKAFHAVVHFLGISVVRQPMHTRPLPEKAIYISNHSSSFELFIITCLLNKTDYVIDANVLKIPVINKILLKGPLIFIQRGSLQSRVDCLSTMAKRLAEGRNVMLFPEGYSHKYLSSHFAMGAFQASWDTGVPIVPIYMHYDNLDAFVPDAKVNHKKEFFRILFAPNKRIKAYIFDSISPSTFKNPQDYRDAVYQQYCQWQHDYYGC